MRRRIDVTRAGLLIRVQCVQVLRENVGLITEENNWI